MHARVAVVGAGAAGLALACRLGEQGTPDVVLIEAPPGPHSSPERTWCTWQQGSGPWPDAVAHRWERVAVTDRHGVRDVLDLAPLSYTMVRSSDYVRVVGERLSRTAVQRVEAHVTDVRDGAERAVVVGADLAEDLTADLVFDTRPTPPAAPGRTALLQHFRGWFVRTEQDAFDPSVAGLMDFRPPQPRGGVAFSYVLPTSPREALVEHTLFSRTAWTAAQYDDALRATTRELPPFEVVATEQGAIPMTDAPFPRRVGQRVFRLGAAGGATRPSTGYTFTAAQRQAEQVARALREGRDPTPPPAYSRRHLWMDGVLLRALDGGTVEGADFFVRLFRAHPAERVLRFLDGTTTLAEDLAVMASAPAGAMVRTVLGR